MTKYGLAVADFHCGHLVGLTPPKWQVKSYDASSTKRNKWNKIEQDLWLSFQKILKQIPKLDFLFINGDMIDGKGKRSGGVELITADMDEQTDMAVFVINEIRKYGKKDLKVIATYGTDYHVCTEGDEWENKVADKAGIDKIGNHEWVNVNGLVFDLKHHIGNSGSPMGNYTSMARDGVWNDLWSLTDLQPQSDIILRGHTHQYRHCGSSNKICMTLPALQAMGSRYGAKRCSAMVDWGCVLFEVKNKHDFNWYPYIRNIESQKARAIKI